MNELIFYLSGSFLFYLSYFILGLFIYEKFYAKILEINFLEATLLGLLGISILALIINFFLPLSQGINLFVLISIYALLFFIKDKKLIQIIKYNLIFTVSLFIFTVFARNPEDASLYHLSYIAILNSEPINFGLTNFHSRFGHTSIIQYLSAISYIPYLSKYTIISQNNFIYCLVITIFLTKLNLNFKRNEIYSIYFKLLCLVFITLKFSKYSDWGNDLSPAILTFYVVSFLIDYLSRDNNEQSFNYIYLYLLLITTFIFLTKISYIIIFSILILLFFKNIKITKFFNHKIILFFSLILSIFFIRNFIISSCIIYPINFTCIETIWNSPDLNKAIFLQTKSWSMSISDLKNLNMDPEIYIKNFNWINTWLSVHFIKIIEKVFTFLAMIILVLIFLKLKLKNKNKIYNVPNFHYYLLLLFTIYVTFWFLSAPLFRYGTGFIIVLVILIIIPFILKHMNYLTNSNINFFKKFIIFLIITIIITKNSIRVLNDSEGRLIPKTFNSVSLNSMDFNDQKIFYSNGTECYYSTKSPCLKHKPSTIKNIANYGKYKIYIGF